LLLSFYKLYESLYERKISLAIGLFSPYTPSCMEEVIFCSSCGKVVDRGYNYCPFCGSHIGQGPALQDVIDESFEHIEETVRRLAFKRLEDIERQLDSLECELSAFMSRK